MMWDHWKGMRNIKMGVPLNWERCEARNGTRILQTLGYCGYVHVTHERQYDSFVDIQKWR
jgi:hypothetical protein